MLIKTTAKSMKLKPGDFATPFPTQGEELEIACRQGRAGARGTAPARARHGGSAGSRPASTAKGRGGRTGAATGRYTHCPATPSRVLEGRGLLHREKLLTQPAVKLLRLIQDTKLSENFC